MDLFFFVQKMYVSEHILLECIILFIIIICYSDRYDFWHVIRIIYKNH